jgi:hypothetical protein
MGTGNSAANAANAANAQQQQQIQQSVNQINNAYSSPARQSQYQQYNQNLSNYYTGQVNNQEAVNSRNLGFAMDRSGLQGGSASVDSNTQLQKDYTQGLLQASQAATAGTSALEQSDINAKNQLIGLAQQGNFTGAIPTATAQAQGASLGAAQNYGQANSLNNLFAGTAGIYQNEATAAANRQAQQNPFGTVYSASGLTGGGTGGQSKPGY